jgi:hypothetical protein
MKLKELTEGEYKDLAGDVSYKQMGSKVATFNDRVERNTVSDELRTTGRKLDNLNNLKLTSLKGMPKITKVNVDVHDNLLTTLEGGPQKCIKSFVCRENPLRTLQGAPTSVGGAFDISEIKTLKSLKGCPEKVGSFEMVDVPGVTSLDEAPKIVGPSKDGSTFRAGQHHEWYEMGTINISKSDGITSFTGIGSKYFKEASKLIFTAKITSSVLGLLRIKGLQRIETPEGPNDEWLKYIQPHLPVDGSPHQLILKVQSEMIDAGLDEWAKL